MVLFACVEVQSHSQFLSHIQTLIYPYLTNGPLRSYWLTIGASPFQTTKKVFGKGTRRLPKGIADHNWYMRNHPYSDASEFDFRALPYLTDGPLRSYCFTTGAELSAGVSTAVYFDLYGPPSLIYKPLPLDQLYDHKHTHPRP